MQRRELFPFEPFMTLGEHRQNTALFWSNGWYTLVHVCCAWLSCGAFLPMREKMWCKRPCWKPGITSLTYASQTVLMPGSTAFVAICAGAGNALRASSAPT
jgi:hypothetical protein